ncbi:MAG: three-Cys-motif partner protein TcmP [Anaerolineae bacterium]|nr:three-Cys-motif partner protein TcmP [Anaerolineae bacterium]
MDKQQTLWRIEPHTLAKHEILDRYLGAWFAILGSTNRRIVYLDGFCGPGKYLNGEPGSPIIALKKAMNHQAPLSNTECVFLFIDERSDRVDHLCHEIDLLAPPSNFTIDARVGEFRAVISELLAYLEQNTFRLAPTFAFIDPFGWKGLPFDLVRRLLRNQHTEVLINFMADSINRFVEHPDTAIQEHFVELFGTKEVFDVASKATDRLSALRNLYQKQLLTQAKYVRYFEMRDQHGRPIYYLFFASNHPLGHSKMKEAFWKVDPTSGFTFSDGTNPDQLVLFSLDPTEDLAALLKRHFAGTTVTSDLIVEFVLDETAFIETHAKKALRILEERGSIQVNPFKVDGTKRTRGFPKGVKIRFL